LSEVITLLIIFILSKFVKVSWQPRQLKRVVFIIGELFWKLENILFHLLVYFIVKWVLEEKILGGMDNI
jgi:hypothetical protein